MQHLGANTEGPCRQPPCCISKSVCHSGEHPGICSQLDVFLVLLKSTTISFVLFTVEIRWLFPLVDASQPVSHNQPLVHHWYTRPLLIHLSISGDDSALSCSASLRCRAWRETVRVQSPVLLRHTESHTSFLEPGADTIWTCNLVAVQPLHLIAAVRLEGEAEEGLSVFWCQRRYRWGWMRFKMTLCDRKAVGPRRVWSLWVAYYWGSTSLSFCGW